MASNVLPTAPAYEQTETQTTLYPVLQTQPDNNYFLNCVPKITYLCSKLCNDETHKQIDNK